MASRKLVVIGNGMVGQRFLEKLAGTTHDYSVTVLCEEPRPAYDRVGLSGFTDGMVDRLKAMGLTSEIIAWKLRLFVPTGATGPAILGALMERYPLVRIADRGAA